MSVRPEDLFVICRAYQQELISTQDYQLALVSAAPAALAFHTVNQLAELGEESPDVRAELLRSAPVMAFVRVWCDAVVALSMHGAPTQAAMTVDVCAPFIIANTDQPVLRKTAHDGP